MARDVEHCSFDYMKAHAEQMAPLGGAIFDGGGRAFINKGTNGRWRDVLTAEEMRRLRGDGAGKARPRLRPLAGDGRNLGRF